MKQIIGIFALVLLASACKKDETFEGSITIDAPSVNAQLQADSTITIQGSATGNMELHGYVLEVTNTTTGAVIYTVEEHVHAESVTISKTFTHGLTVQTPLNLNVKVEYDHDGNYIEKNVQFNWKP